MILGYINQQLVELGIWFWVFFFNLLVPFVFNVILQIKKEKEKSSINLIKIKPNTPLMNKTLNEHQDLIENAQIDHGTAEDWSWRFGMDSEVEAAMALSGWMWRWRCVYWRWLDLTIGEDLKLFGYMVNVRFIWISGEMY